jgi:hypothetical protein
VNIERHGIYDNAQHFTAQGLIPNTQYAFRVRDYDTELTATAWSAWIVLTTGAASDDEVDLVLDDGSSTVIGNASVQVNGTFTSTVTVPTTVSPGTYILRAMMSGSQRAQTTIEVIAAGQALRPVIQVLRPDGLPFTKNDFAVSNSPVHLRGLNFAPSANVDLFIDRFRGGPKLGWTFPDANGAFTVAPIWPYGVIGDKAVVARQGVEEATVSLKVVNPPK